MSANKIIKGVPFQEQTSAAGVVKRPVVDAKAEARNIVAEAEAYAAATRADAEASARAVREAAYKEGYEAALAELNEHLLDARERRDHALAAVERDVLRLAIKVAEKIIGREIERDAATVADIVTTALRYARLNEMLTVRVNAADLPAIEAHRGRLDPAGRARFLDFVSDPRVARGGCVIESESGAVDAQLETQLRVLERALLTRAPEES